MFNNYSEEFFKTDSPTSMEKSHKRNFHENLFLFKGCGNPRASSELSIVCWLGWVQHVLLAFEENVKMSWKWFWIHPASSALCHSEAFHLRSHAVYGNWRWTPVRMPRGEKHGGKWVKPTWLSCEQSHRKTHFFLPWVRFCPMTIIGHAYFWCHLWLEMSIMHHLPLPLRPP